MRDLMYNLALKLLQNFHTTLSFDEHQIDLEICMKSVSKISVFMKR